MNALYFSATMRSSSVWDKIITVRNFILPNDHPRIIRCRFRRLHATWCWWASCSFVTNYFVFCFSLMFFTALDAWFRPEAKIMFGQRKWPCLRLNSWQVCLTHTLDGLCCALALYFLHARLFSLKGTWTELWWRTWENIQCVTAIFMPPTSFFFFLFMYFINIW